jgi:hypothetical protein
MNSFKDAKQQVEDRFPYQGYMDISVDSYLNTANTVTKYLEPGAKILDFASGPCDKTAIIQSMGYQCSAFDDLQDDWHTIDNNQEKILEFARSFGIDFKLASEAYLPFEKASFDMVNDLAELIVPNGLLFITVPSAVNIKKRIEVLMGKTNLPDYAGYYWSPGPWRGHIREYAKNDLKELAEYIGFEVEELHGCHHMLHVVPKPILPIYLSLTKLVPDFRDSWLLVARKPVGWEAKRKLSDSEYAQIIGKYSPYYLS